jgi:hypothetical protein
VSTHRLIRIIFATLCGLATVLATEVMRVPVHAAQSPSLVTFDRADFILSDERRPPDNDAAWQPVRLPDQWRHRLPAGTRGQGWYRIRFDLPRDPTSMLEVGITHPRAFRTAFIVNGKSIGGAGDLIARRHGTREKLDLGLGFGTPLHVTVPPSLLHAGGNVIHVRVNATSSGTFMHGLPQVTLGDAVAMRDVYIARSEAGFSAQRAFFAMALTTGIITFFLWLARRGDRVLFWYSVACLMWGLISVPRIGLRWVEIFLPAIPVLAWFLNYALVVPLIILCLRTVHL